MPARGGRTGTASRPPNRAASCYGATSCQADGGAWPLPMRPWDLPEETLTAAEEARYPARSAQDYFRTGRVSRVIRPGGGAVLLVGRGEQSEERADPESF